MKTSIVFLIFTLLGLNLAFAQIVDSTTEKKKFVLVGSEFFYSNLSATFENEAVILEQGKQRFSAISVDSKLSFGVNIALRKKMSERFTVSPEVGLFFLRGDFVSREYVGSIGDRAIVEKFDLSFENFYAHTSYSVECLFLKKAGLTFVFAPRIAFQFKSETFGLKEDFYYDYYGPSGIEIEKADTENGFIEYPFNIGAVFLKYGIRKKINCSNDRFIELGIEQDYSVVGIFPYSDMRSNPFVFSIRYGFQK